MSHAALLSCGPSLADYRPNGHDVVIAVNDACERFACDWCVCCDEHVATGLKPISECRFVMARLLVLRDPRFEGGIDSGTVTVDGLESHEWGGYSSTTALAFAAMLGARSIDVYGVDMIGEFDHRGIRGDWRNPGRWARERVKWNTARAALEEAGIEVSSPAHRLAQ